MEEEMKVFQYFQKYWSIGSLDLKFWVLYRRLQKSQAYFKVTEKASGTERNLKSQVDLNTISTS